MNFKKSASLFCLGLYCLGVSFWHDLTASHVKTSPPRFIVIFIPIVSAILPAGGKVSASFWINKKSKLDIFVFTILNEDVIIVRPSVFD